MQELQTISTHFSFLRICTSACRSLLTCIVLHTYLDIPSTLQQWMPKLFSQQDNILPYFVASPLLALASPWWSSSQVQNIVFFCRTDLLWGETAGSLFSLNTFFSLIVDYQGLRVAQDMSASLSHLTPISFCPRYRDIADMWNLFYIISKRGMDDEPPAHIRKYPGIAQVTPKTMCNTLLVYDPKLFLLYFKPIQWREDLNKADWKCLVCSTRKKSSKQKV